MSYVLRIIVYQKENMLRSQAPYHWANKTDTAFNTSNKFPAFTRYSGEAEVALNPARDSNPESPDNSALLYWCSEGQNI